MDDRNEHFGKVWGLWEDSIYNFIKFRVSDTGIAEQLSQDVFTAYFKELKNGKEMDAEHTKNWLYLCAKNRIKNYETKASTTREILGDIEIASEYDCEEDILRDLMREAIKKLNKRDKFVVKSRLESRTYDEIGRALKRSSHSAECIYSRAVAKLRKIIDEMLKGL